METFGSWISKRMDGLKTNIQEQWLLEAVLGKQQTGFFFYCWYLGIYLVTNFHFLWTVCFQSSTRLVFLHLESVCTYACMCVCVFRLLCSWAQLTSLQNLSRPVVLEMDVSHQKPLQGYHNTEPYCNLSQASVQFWSRFCTLWTNHSLL